MKAMVLKKIFNLSKDYQPLELTEIPVPVPARNELLIKISACGVCHTELDEIEGRTPPLKFPIIPGHQIVGKIVQTGDKVTKFKINDRVGIAWIYSACGRCEFCKKGFENLCSEFKATGRDANGGYAEYVTINENYAFAIPRFFSDYEAAPLLCAGAIGYRSLKLTGIINGNNLGLTGFGASAHLVLKMVKFLYPRTAIYVFARNPGEREFAISLGAVWAGDTTDTAPEKLNAIIDTTPVWKPVVEALKNLKPGGRLVINAIRKENIDKNYLLNIEYPTHLWYEKEIKTVANVCKNDVSEFIKIAAQIPVKPEIQLFTLKDANKALVELKKGIIKGAKVLKI